VHVFACADVINKNHDKLAGPNVSIILIGNPWDIKIEQKVSCKYRKARDLCVKK
jgi:hypothetical protein